MSRLEALAVDKAFMHGSIPTPGLKSPGLPPGGFLMSASAAPHCGRERVGGRRKTDQTGGRRQTGVSTIQLLINVIKVVFISQISGRPIMNRTC